MPAGRRCQTTPKVASLWCSTGRSPVSVHRASADRHQFGMYLGNGGELVGAIRFIEQRPFVAQGNPQASQTFQNNAAFRIGDELDGAVAFDCFAPWIDL